MQDIEEFRQKIESRLRTGGVSDAVHMLESFETAKLSDQDRCRFAELCRRAGRSDLALKALKRRIQGLNPPSGDEVVEYCMALRELGAYEEVEMRLAQVDFRGNRSAAMCEIFMAFNRWSPDEIRAACEYYLQEFTEPDYQRAVVQLNLAAGNIASNRLEVGRSQVSELIVEFQIQEWTRLLSNCHELMAQVEIKESRLDRALLHLEKAKSLFSEEELKDSLFVHRWQATIDARKTQTIEPLIAFREKAKSLNHYESVRAADYEIFNLRRDEQAWAQLYIGTPFPAYRRLLRSEFPTVEPPVEYRLNRGGERLLDVAAGVFDSEELLKPGSKSQQLLQVLFLDLYKPISIGGIFGQLFPEEYYDPELSSKRVHQLIYRLRKSFDEKKCAISIEKAGMSYSTHVEDAISVSLTGKKPQDREQHMLDYLATHTQDRSFSAGEVESWLSLSQPSAHRLLRRGMDKGLIFREGFGVQTRYVLRPEGPNPHS